MQTFFKTITEKRAKAIKAEREAKTGIKFDVYYMHGGFAVCPVITRQTTEIELGRAEALLPFITKNGDGFVKLSEASGIPLADVLVYAKTLVRANIGVVGEVNRMGNFAGVHITPQAWREIHSK